MGYRMGYIRALMGYRRVCEVAFQRVRLEEAALGGRAGFRVDSGLGRVGWAGRRGGSSRGRAGLGSGQASVGLVWVKLRVGTGWVRGGVGPGSGRAGLLQVGSGRVGSGSGRARAWPGFGPPKLPEAQKPHPRNLPNSPVTHRKLSSRSIVVSCFPINPVCRAQAARSVKDRPT